ncbi:O-antigen ligase family protein [Actinoplanes sp. KI2]|uniref:O-antigen ligase family protein n=1 Tax=Actinoplanes sp. KI2 TaxID=2983315 RepID=UPI0021D5FCAC|nr:O-antigen ligase family protein [Actinoplanes sp. KI2]MCU7726412.1 O-antigen ligase family protein [Actinoplanes sp. KI2]
MSKDLAKATTREASAGQALDQTVVVRTEPRRSAALQRVTARARVRTGGVNPATILTVYVVLLMLVPSRLVVGGLGAVGTMATIWALVGLLWIAGSWFTRRIQPLPGSRVPRLVMVPLAVAVMVAYVACGRRDASALEVNAADRGVILLAAWWGIVLIGSAVDDLARLKKLLRVLVRCATVAAVIGIAEFFLHRDLLGWLVIPGLQSNAATDAVMTRGAFTRPTSTAIHPLELATTLAMILPFALQQAFDPATKGGVVRRWAPVALIAVASLATVSRSAVIGIVLVFLVLYPTWSSKRRWPAVGFLIVALGGLKVAIPGFLSTITSMFTAWFNGTDTSTQARVMDYQDVFGYVAQRPWSGMGFGSFLPAIYRYTDNMYLLALVEMGIIGVAALLVLFIAMIHNGGAARRRLTDPADRELALSFVAAGVVVLICTATFDTLSFPMVSGLFFLLLGLSGALSGLSAQQLTAEGQMLLISKQASEEVVV